MMPENRLPPCMLIARGPHGSGIAGAGHTMDRHAADALPAGISVPIGPAPAAAVLGAGLALPHGLALFAHGGLSRYRAEALVRGHLLLRGLPVRVPAHCRLPKLHLRFPS